MGLSRDSRHKRRKTSGRQKSIKMKRKYELARPAANTRLLNTAKKQKKRVHAVRVRGGAYKYRGLRLDTGNFSWGTYAISRRAKIMDVVYNASSNELVRTKTLVKSAIVEIDASPFRTWYEAHTGVSADGKALTTETKVSARTAAVKAARAKANPLHSLMKTGFGSGRLLAKLTSRPGQSGRCDGQILEGKELEFYVRKMRAKKSAK